MNRSADWLHQAQADLELAGVSSAAGHHEWACFACHQAVEKALKGLHLRHGQQAWGHGLGRSCRELPPAVAAELATSVSDLEDRLRILDALYIPTRSPDSLPDGAPTDHHCCANA
jgi:HEPN domain-containing protein